MVYYSNCCLDQSHHNPCRDIDIQETIWLTDNRSVEKYPFGRGNDDALALTNLDTHNYGRGLYLCHSQDKIREMDAFRHTWNNSHCPANLLAATYRYEAF